MYRKSHTLCQTVALRAGHSECRRRARVCHDALGTPTPPAHGGPQPSQTSATRHRRTGGPGLKPKTRFLVPFDSLAESGPEPNPETKKKDPVWFALNRNTAAFGQWRAPKFDISVACHLCSSKKLVLQRFDDRRQLVIQEATAATTTYDRLSLFGGDDALRLQTSLKDYVRARIDLYRMAHDFLLVERAEDFSDQQEKKLLELKNRLWDAAVAACPQPNYRPACALSLPALNSLFEVAVCVQVPPKTSATDHLFYAVWPSSWLLTSRRVWDGRERRA